MEHADTPSEGMYVFWRLVVIFVPVFRTQLE